MIENKQSTGSATPLGSPFSCDVQITELRCFWICVHHEFTKIYGGHGRLRFRNLPLTREADNQTWEHVNETSVNMACTEQRKSGGGVAVDREEAVHCSLVNTLKEIFSHS